MAGKTIHVHVGPHKTGSTTIQHALQENSALLAQQAGLTHIPYYLLNKTKKFLIAGKPEEARDSLASIVEICATAPGDCILSCEDLCGKLPGALRTRQIYPQLWQNLKIVRDTLGEVHTRFYFFLRDPADWARSTYVQNLKYRHRFKRFDDFIDALDLDGLWLSAIREAAENLGPDFVTIDYPTEPDSSITRCLLRAIPGLETQSFERLVERRLNISPSESDVTLMEFINRSSASQQAKSQAKLALFSPQERPRLNNIPDHPAWTGAPEKPADLPGELGPLWRRVERRVHRQDQPNLMPPVDDDLTPLRHRIVEEEGDLPDLGRAKMTDQAELLVYRFRNQPETCFLLGLVISYLRRSTAHTRHASILFQRLWAEEYDILLGCLPTRWLISTFQTFLDHGINEQQRIIGSGAYFYANILKAYETERAFEGLEPDATYPHSESQTRMGFAGLDRFRLGNTDLMLNTNALLLEYSATDNVAGRPVREFLARTRTAKTLFSRMDKSRQAHGINQKQFLNCWSFFDEP